MKREGDLILLSSHTDMFSFPHSKESNEEVKNKESDKEMVDDIQLVTVGLSS
jgi:hypothetical protein